MMTYVEKLKKFPNKTVKLDRFLQAYREAGQGDHHLVLLHGISSGSGSWINQLEDLGHQFHILAWDAPGYGQSDGLATKTPKATDYAVRLKALFDALNIKKAIIVGHSLGALQASAFAHDYPEYVEALVITNAAQGYGQSDAETQLQVFQKRPKMLQELGAEGMAKSRGPHLVYKQDSNALSLIENVMVNISLDGFTNASYLLAYDDIRNYLKNLKIKTVVIAAKQDGITPIDGIKKLAEDLNLCNFQQIDQAGHLSYLDQPDVFNNIILEIIHQTK
ncbi:alpha/beta fold hydrolase [Acinetobacter stercoris]|nr:alpha/beta hydrolase [Acinetobacter stercoris]